MDNASKVRENRLRRMATRQGLQLHRSPRRDTRALDYGLYRLLPGDDTWISIDEVQAHLTGTTNQQEEQGAE